MIVSHDVVLCLWSNIIAYQNLTENNTCVRLKPNELFKKKAILLSRIPEFKQAEIKHISKLPSDYEIMI
jgi:hypothetical protein